MKKVRLFIGVTVILVVAFLYAHIAKTNIIYDKNVDNSEYIETGVVEKTIEQEFVCKEETLDGITAKCRLQGDASGTSMKMKLIDESTNEVVANSKIQAENIKNSKFNVFSFDTIENCKNKTYKVVFENVNASVEEMRGICLVYQPKTENKTRLVIDSEDIDGTLIIKTVTKRFDFETFFVLIVFITFIAGFIKGLYKLFS
ncbi:hypothetical protein [[Clostridium] scindens]|uniref:hypothetical protein n=1 Tax=Clostridium scindens (strain JCM 10418 / VPI 12708) TaxID=29347 RepID=UPI001AA1D424|nr:hypothetical protein [[Clostridium] scindens]MBO1681314.1 hypothetical protein [[Clostridium] scindens]